jgi:hypothetical protein
VARGPLDEAANRFRLSTGPRQAALSIAQPEIFHRGHIGALHAVLQNPRMHVPGSWAFIDEPKHGFRWTLRNDWNTAVALARACFEFLKAGERPREAASIYELLRTAARQHDDSQLAEECTWELSWIPDEPGEAQRGVTAGGQLTLNFT